MSAQQSRLHKPLNNFGQEDLGDALMFGDLLRRFLGPAFSRGYIQHGPDSILSASTYKWHTTPF
jgi:hypothetical protein